MMPHPLADMFAHRIVIPAWNRMDPENVLTTQGCVQLRRGVVRFVLHKVVAAWIDRDFIPKQCRQCRKNQLLGCPDFGSRHDRRQLPVSSESPGKIPCRFTGKYRGRPEGPMYKLLLALREAPQIWTP